MKMDHGAGSGTSTAAPYRSPVTGSEVEASKRSKDRSQ